MALSTAYDTVVSDASTKALVPYTSRWLGASIGAFISAASSEPTLACH